LPTPLEEIGKGIPPLGTMGVVGVGVVKLIDAMVRSGRIRRQGLAADDNHDNHDEQDARPPTKRTRCHISLISAATRQEDSSFRSDQDRLVGGEYAMTS
jgi:hypothetical protein